MAFGPESKNPRERRAYAHTIIAKLAAGEASYGDALRAAWYAGRTTKGAHSWFDQALQNAADKVEWPEEQGDSNHRKLRRAPLDWEPPKDENGYNTTMYDTRYGDGRYSISEVDHMISSGNITSVEDLTSRFIPPFLGVDREDMGLYVHSATVATPLTPVFPDTSQGHDELSAYAAENVSWFGGEMATADDWKRRFFEELQIAG